MNPSDCFVCGKAPHKDRADHNYFSTEKASAWFDRQPIPVGNSEAAYVENHRPY